MLERYTFYAICDTCLRAFLKANDGYLDNDYFAGLPYDDEVLTFLTQEGLLQELPHGHKIAYKGRVVLNSGGLKRAHILRDLTTVSSIVAAIASVVGVVVAFLL